MHHDDLIQITKSALSATLDDDVKTLRDEEHNDSIMMVMVIIVYFKLNLPSSYALHSGLVKLKVRW